MSSLWVAVPLAQCVGAGVVPVCGDCCGRQGTVVLLPSLQRQVSLWQGWAQALEPGHHCAAASHGSPCLWPGWPSP